VIERLLGNRWFYVVVVAAFVLARWLAVR